MSKLLIAYYSRTGNTAQMAEAVARGAASVPGAQVQTRPVESLTPEDLLACDALILGSPVYYGGPAAEIKALLDASAIYHGKLDGKVGGAFATGGVVGGGMETTVLDLIHALLVHGMIVKGESGGAHFGAVAVGAPDDAAASACERLGRSVATLAQRLFG